MGKVVFYVVVVAIAVVFGVLLILWQRIRSKHGIGNASEKDQLHRGIEDLRRSKEKTESLPRTPFSIREFTQTFFKEKIIGRDRPKLQIIFLTSFILYNGYLGYAFEHESSVAGWQLWIWLGTVALAALVLIPPRKFIFHPNKTWLALALLFLVAFLLRGTFLEKLPPGLHIDESGTADFSMRYVFAGFERTLSPFRSGGNSQPTLYNYVIWLSIKLIGYTKTGLRMPQAVAGSLAVLATYFLISLLQNRRTAWMAAILMACYQYSIHWSRLGLNNIWATLWVPLVLALFLWGWRKKWNGGAVLAGLALGLSVYFYPGVLIVFFLLAYLIIDLWLKNIDRQQLVVDTGKMLAMAACVASPLIIFALLEPGLFFDRSRVVFAWTPTYIAQITGNSHAIWKFFWYQFVQSFGAYNFYTDGSGFYASGIPFLIGLASPLMVAGLIWAIYKKQNVLTIWLIGVTIMAGIMVTGTPAGSHFIASIPAICWAVACSLDGLMELGWHKTAIALLVIMIVTDLVFYFIIYPSVPRGDLNLPMPPFPK